MENRTKQLIAALVLGALAFGVNYYYISENTKAPGPDSRVTVIIAKKTIPAGTPLAQSMVGTSDVDKSSAPKTAIRPSELQSLIGQPVGLDIQTGDYVLSTYFAGEGRSFVGFKLSEQIQDDQMRAVTMPVDENNSLSRSIVSGDHIDLTYTINIPGSPEKLSVLLLQDVPVISTGTYSSADADLATRGGRRYASLTLRLPIQDAMRLNYARATGQIGVLLRGARATGKESSAAVSSPAITSVRDVLTATQKDVFDSMLRQSQAPAQQNADKFREQMKELFEAQRNQSRR